MEMRKQSVTANVFYNLNRPGRAVRVVSLGLCSACLINLQPNILLKKGFFLFIYLFLIYFPGRVCCGAVVQIPKQAILHFREVLAVAVGGKMTAVINRHFTGGGNIFTPEPPLIPPSSAHSFEYARAN